MYADRFAPIVAPLLDEVITEAGIGDDINHILPWGDALWTVVTSIL